MAPPCDQRNDGSLRAYLQRPAPRSSSVVAATASDQATDRDNRADAKLQLLAVRRQNKKDKEKARKERRKLHDKEQAAAVTATATVTAAAAAAAAVPGAAVAVAIESQGKQTATGAVGAGAISQVAVAVAVAATATAAVAESVESEESAASGGSGAPAGSAQAGGSAEAAGPRQSLEAPESKEASGSQESEEETEEATQARQSGKSTEPVKLGQSGGSSSSSTEESGKSAHQSRQSGAELGQSGESPAGVKEGAMTESSSQLAMDVDVAAVEVGVAAASKAELSAPPSSSSAAASSSPPLPSPSSVASTTVGGDNTSEEALARQRFEEPLLPMLKNKKNDDDNSQVTEIKKVVTTHIAAEAVEAAQGATAPAVAVVAAAAATTAASAVETAAAAAVAAAKEAGEKAEQHALLEKRKLNMSTGVVRDQAQEEEEATGKSKNRPVLRLPPARKHAAGPLKAVTSPTEAPELLLPAARDLWTGRCQSSRGGLKKEDLHPLVLEAIRDHPDMFELSPDELSVYVDTVLSIVFYWYSRCGIVRMCDLRSGGFIQELDAVGRLEMGLEESEYFSLARHEVMRTEFFRLCDGGWSVGHEALRWYRHYGDGTVVGAVRARRVIDAGLRPFPREKPTGSGMSGVGGYGDELEYDAWVCFFLCEEALRNGTWSERDVRYCFHLVDETGRGRVGMTEVTRFFEDMQWDSVISGYSEDANWPSVQEVISHHLDSMAVEKRRDYVTLKEMTRSDYTVDRAGNFFEEVFAGTAPPENGYSNNEDEYEGDDYEGTGGGEDGNSETTGEHQCSHSTGGEEGGDAEGTFDGTGEKVGGNGYEGTRQEGQQCQPPPPPPPPPLVATAPTGAVPCALPEQPVQTVQTPVPYLQNIGGTFYPAQGLPLEQHGHQPWAPNQGNIAGGYPTSPSPGPPPPPPPLCAQAQAVAYGNHVEAACAIPSSPGMQPPPPPPQTGVVFSDNIGGACYPVQVPPVEQRASPVYYAGNVAGDTRCGPTPLYPQPHTSAYGGTVAGVSCPTQAGYMQPQGLAYGGHVAGVFPRQQTGYMQPQQPGAYGERFEGMRPVGMGYMQPHPLAYGGNLGGMCPMPPVSMPQYPPPVAYGGNPYPMQMPQWQ